MRMHKSIAYILTLLLAVLTLAFAIWGPERIARYQDERTLNRVTVEEAGESSEGYRYSLSSNEKLYILAKCLNSQSLPESEQSSRTRVESQELGYEELTGSYAFIMNRQGPTGEEITEEEIFNTCNRQLEELKELGILPQEVKEVTDISYDAVLYSAIDVLEPRNNLAVWKVSLSTNQQNADKSNRLLDAYVDADTGRIYEFYVRIGKSWSELDPEEIIAQWSTYLGLSGMEEYESDNPLLETTPHFKKFRFPGTEVESTVVTIGFYEGINELYIKISK